MQNIRLVLIIFTVLIFTGQVIHSWGQTDAASQYLYEYAVKLYHTGRTEEAVQELNKSLMVHPDNCAAKTFLRNIAPGMELKISTPSYLSASGGKRVCPYQEVTFEASLPSHYGQRDFIYSWDFGDGTLTKGGPNMSHSYSKGGRYIVWVSVDEQKRTSCPRDSELIEVYVNSRPIAEAGPNQVCCVNKESVFDASGSHDPDGDSLDYFWQFGDGAVLKGKKVTHKYVRAGQYKVTLTVNDNAGLACGSSSVSFLATVADKPLAVMDVTGQK